MYLIYHAIKHVVEKAFDNPKMVDEVSLEGIVAVLNYHNDFIFLEDDHNRYRTKDCKFLRTILMFDGMGDEYVFSICVRHGDYLLFWRDDTYEVIRNYESIERLCFYMKEILRLAHPCVQSRDIFDLSHRNTIYSLIFDTLVNKLIRIVKDTIEVDGARFFTENYYYRSAIGVYAPDRFTFYLVLGRQECFKVWFYYNDLYEIYDDLGDLIGEIYWSYKMGVRFNTEAFRVEAFVFDSDGRGRLQEDTAEKEVFEFDIIEQRRYLRDV